LGRIKNNAIYYTKTSSNSLNAKNYYRSLLEPSLAEAAETQLTGTNYSNIAVLDNNRGVVVSNDSQLIYVSDVFSEDGIEVLVDEKVTILFEQGDYVYYTYGDKNRLARINVINKQIDNLTNEEDELKVDKNLKVDYDNEYVYVFKKYSNDDVVSYYLERVKYMTTTFESEFVGVFRDIHAPVEEETEEQTEQE